MSEKVGYKFANWRNRPQDLLFEVNCFDWLSRIVAHQFCYEVSALVMLSLKECPLSRIVRGMLRDPNGYQKSIHHSWVEVEYHNKWWVIDPIALCGGSPRVYTMREADYRGLALPCVTRVHGYAEFWDYDLSQTLYKWLQEPELPWKLCTLLSAYRQDERYGLNEFNQSIHTLGKNCVAQSRFVNDQIDRGVWPYDLKNWVDHYIKIGHPPNGC